MSYPYTGSSYPLRYIPVSTDLGNRYGNTMSTSSTLGTGLTSTGASGYSGDRRWTRESGTTSNLATKLGELEIHGSRENSNLPITDPSRNFSSSFYSSSNHEQDKLVNDMFTSKRSPAPSPSPSNLRQEEGDKPEPVDPRSSLRKLLDCVKDLQDLDVEKCLRDYKIIKEASDPMGLTKEEEYAKSNKSLPRIESHDNEKDNLRRKVSELQAKVSALENQDGTSKQEVERVKKEYREKKDALLLKWREVLGKKEAEALEKETNFQEQIDDLKRQLKSKEAYIEEIRKALSELRVEKDQVEKEKTEALTRLSKEMSSKLNDKNPNITDLSDSNRPTKIAEKYNELYDNEWTDALEELTEERYLEEVAISELLACVQAAYSFCQKAASNQIENLRRALTNPGLSLGSPGSSAAQSVNSEAEKMLEEVRKSQKISGDVLLKEFERETSFKGLYKTMIPVFTVKCLELCWLMNMHNPPVALGLPPTKDSPFDGTFYKEYTRTGTTVDFVVWLPLLLHKNGPLLQKGVLQPNPSMSRSLHQKPLSAPANLSKSRHNKEQFDTSGPQADRPNVRGRTTHEPSVHGTERGSYDYLYGKQRQSPASGYQQNKTTSFPNDPLPDQSHQNVRGQTGYNTGTNQDRMYDDQYRDKYKSTAAYQSSNDYSTRKHDNPQKSTRTTNYGSSRASQRSTDENYNSPRLLEVGGKKFVQYQGRLFDYDYYLELEKQILRGSSEA